jgi:hypothetical protein
MSHNDKNSKEGGVSEGMIVNEHQSIPHVSLADDSDDESDFMFPAGLNLTNIIEINDVTNQNQKTHPLSQIMSCLLTRDLITLKNLKEQQAQVTPPDHEKDAAFKVTEFLLQGKYLEIILHNSFLSYQKLFQICSSSKQPVEDISQLLSTVIQTAFLTSLRSAEFTSFHCLVIGYAYYELFCQCNYTGPELSTQELSQLLPASDEISSIISTNVHKTLECDGIYPFRLSQLPHTLFISRILLRYLADPSRASWQQGIQLDMTGNIFSKLSSQELDLKTIRSTQFLGILKNWFSFRVCLCHTRLLQSQHYSKLPTLWKECQDLIIQMDQNIQQFQQEALREIPLQETQQQQHSKFLPTREISSLYLLEKGLCYHHFDYQDKVLVDSQSLSSSLSLSLPLPLSSCLSLSDFSSLSQGKQFFNSAKDSAKLDIKLTAAMGKRTKYQLTDYAQLLLVAKSSLVDEHTQADARTLQQVILTKSKADNPSANTKEGWEHGKFELGRRVIKESKEGEEVSIRNIQLDDADGGEAENILFEEGVHFTHNDLNTMTSTSAPLTTIQEDGVEESLISTLLHPLDQAIILSLCLDVSNSNPAVSLHFLLFLFFFFFFFFFSSLIHLHPF